MATTIFGEHYISNQEYAKKLILAGLKQPTYRIEVDYIDFKVRGIGLSYFCNGERVSSGLFEKPGIYVLYENYPGADNCLYCGISGNSANNRIRRFMKGLCDCLRHDETHTAGTKARHFGVSFKNIHFKFLAEEDFPDKHDCILDDRYMDEYVASLLNTRFNKKVKQ